MGKITLLIYISSLYSESMDLLLHEFGRNVMLQYGIENLTNTYNDLTGRITYKWAKGTLLPLLRQVLLGSSWTRHGAGGDIQQPLYFASAKIGGTRGATLDDVQTLYIYSDVID